MTLEPGPVAAQILEKTELRIDAHSTGGYCTVLARLEFVVKQSLGHTSAEALFSFVSQQPCPASPSNQPSTRDGPGASWDYFFD